MSQIKTCYFGSRMRHLLGPSIRRGSAAPVAVIVCTAGALAACGPQGISPGPQANQPPSGDSAQTSTPPSPADTAGQQAKTAYLGMWDAMAKAGETSDWKAPELGQFATGNALTAITKSLYADHFNHVVSRGRPNNNPQVTSVEPPNTPTTVMLSDCGDSTNWLQYKKGTNDPVDNESGGRRSITAEVKKQADGAWKVQRFAVEGLGSC